MASCQRRRHAMLISLYAALLRHAIAYADALLITSEVICHYAY